MPSTKPETSIPIIITATDASAPNTPDFKGGMVDRSLLHCGLRTSDTTWRAPDSPLSATSSNGSDEYFDDCSAPSPGGSVESGGSLFTDQHYPFHDHHPISEDYPELYLNRSPSDTTSLFEFDTPSHAHFRRATSSPELNVTGYLSDWTSSAISPDASSGYYIAPPGLGLDHNLSPIYSEDIFGQWAHLDYPGSNSGELSIEESLDIDGYLLEHHPALLQDGGSALNLERIIGKTVATAHTSAQGPIAESEFVRKSWTIYPPQISLLAEATPSLWTTISPLSSWPSPHPHSPSSSPNILSPEPSLLHSPTAYIPNSRPYQIQDPEYGVDDFAPQSLSIDVPQTSTRQAGNAVAGSSKTPDTKFRPEVGSAAMVQACHERRKPENKEGAFHCTEPGCMANFTAKHNLMNHINSHKGIRKFECSLCERKFGTRHVLTRHLRSCKGPKKYGQLTAF
ncbi:hypothetical protein BD779DRAFT_1466105 [Infundibulicybe gibba]|nr:hypothetical protein BD779DRAFT_1466105 [Infundibulicybe gibba]